MKPLLSAGCFVAALSSSAQAARAPETPFAVPANHFRPISYKGVNIAGGEIYANWKNADGGKYGYAYIYPQVEDINYASSQGFGLVRMPFRMHRAQPAVLNALSASELALMKQSIDMALAKNLFVVLDPHDFGYINDYTTGTAVAREIGVDPVGTNEFVDFWNRMATKFKNYPNVIFGLMNEPHDQTAEQWKTGAVAAIAAIRASGSKQLILIPGSNWEAAQGMNIHDNSNGTAWRGYKGDSNYAVEVHQYLDGAGGTKTPCKKGLGASVLNDATSWAYANKVKVFLGEIGWSTDASCPAEAQAAMNEIKANPGAWLGLSYWNAGASSFYKGYMYYVGPRDTTKPQMKVLQSAL